jgi:hypothetical protein
VVCTTSGGERNVTESRELQQRVKTRVERRIVRQTIRKHGSVGERDHKKSREKGEMNHSCIMKVLDEMEITPFIVIQ